MNTLMTATEVAQQLGVSRNYVYDHATELGAIRLGKGPRPRLRFDVERVRQALDPPKPQPQEPRRVRRASRTRDTPHVPLLPIRGDS